MYNIDEKKIKDLKCILLDISKELGKGFCLDANVINNDKRQDIDIKIKFSL